MLFTNLVESSRNLWNRFVFSAKFGFYRELALNQALFMEEFLLHGTDMDMLIPIFRADKYVNLFGPDDGPSVVIMHAPKKYVGTSSFAIYVNRQFGEWFEGDERMAMYMHEVGHILKGHHLTTKYLVIDPQYEIEADLFAAASGYGAPLTNCLGRMVSFVKAVHPGKYRVLEEQLINRMDHLRAFLNQ